MQRFRCRLARALSVRTKQAEAARGALAAALAQLRKAEAVRAAREATLQQWQHDQAEQRRRGMPAGEWILTLSSGQVLADQVAAAHLQVQAAGARVQAASQAYTQARQRLETLERLKARRFTLHQAEARRQEQQELDDVALRRQTAGSTITGTRR